MEAFNILWVAAKALVVVMVLLSLSNLAILAERKVSGWIQGRVGPNRTALPVIGAIPLLGTGITRLGLFQPLADGLKLLLKEDPVPDHVNRFYYFLAPVAAFIPAVTAITVLPFGEIVRDGTPRPIVLADLDIGILFIFAVASLGVYGVILAGWASNSKYPFLGGIRSSAQMISYELAFGLSILPVFMWSNAPGSGAGLNLFAVVQGQQHLWNVFWMPVSALLFLVAIFAETNRLPFDMAESETELVSGFSTEYGSFKFGLFFIAEYTHIIVGSGSVYRSFPGRLAPPFHHLGFFRRNDRSGAIGYGFLRQDLPGGLLLHVDSVDPAPVPLRSDHEAGLDHDATPVPAQCNRICHFSGRLGCNLRNSHGCKENKEKALVLPGKDLPSADLHRVENNLEKPLSAGRNPSVSRGKAGNSRRVIVGFPLW